MKILRFLSVLLATHYSLLATAAFAATPLTDAQLAGANNQVKSGATFTVKNGGTFVMESGSTLTTTGSPWSGAQGGTGVANSGKTITLGGNLTTAGSFATTLTATAATSVTLPTSGTLFSSATQTQVLDAASFAADAGSTDTYVATLSPAIFAYGTGSHYRFKANTANTGAATINFNSVGAKTIVKVAGGITTTLADNDILSGQWVDLVYDGTNMQMQSLLGNAAGAGSGTSLTLPEGSAPSTPASANVVLYAKSDGLLYSKDDAGTETALAGGGSGDMLLGTAQTVTAAKTFNTGTLKMGSSGDLVDANGNELFKFTATSSAVNEITITNAATGSGPTLSATGADTNITLTLAPKGAGYLKFGDGTGNIYAALRAATSSQCFLTFYDGTSEIWQVGKQDDNSFLFYDNTGSATAFSITTGASSGQFYVQKTTASSSTTTGALRVDGGVGVAENLNIGGELRVATKTPSSASDTGVTGTICWDASFIYICTATNTWKRVAIATW